MEDKKQKQKNWNKNLTKEKALNKSYKYEDDGKYIIESNKQRVNISISAGLWEDGKKLSENSSRLVEKLLKEALEKHRGQEVILRKSEF